MFPVTTPTTAGNTGKVRRCSRLRWRKARPPSCGSVSRGRVRMRPGRTPSPDVHTSSCAWHLNAADVLLIDVATNSSVRFPHDRCQTLNHRSPGPPLIRHLPVAVDVIRGPCGVPSTDRTVAALTGKAAADFPEAQPESGTGLQGDRKASRWFR